MKTNVYRFGQLFEIIDGDRGKNYPGDNDFSDVGYCLFLNAGNVTKTGWSFETNAFITKEKDEQLRKGRVKRGDTVLTTRGTVGNAAYYDERVPYDHLRINSGMVILSAKDNTVVDNEYIYYLVTSPIAKKTIELFCSGSAQPQLPIKDFVKIKFNLPAIDKQKRIVSILSAYDNLIEVNNKRIKVLEQMAENLYKEWFVRFRFPGHETVEFENGLPKGWEQNRISQYYFTSSGGTPSRENEENYENGTIPWIKTGEMQDCLLIDTEEHITEAAIKKSSAKLFPKDSVLMAMYGVNIGMLAYSTIEATCNQACCVFKDKGSINTKHYLFQYLKSIREHLLLIGFGAAQQNLSQDLIKQVKILRPDNDTIMRFENVIEPLYQETKKLLEQNSNLIKQRELLLPRLMNGKLEV